MLSIVELGDETVALMAPQTFMNRSGESVDAALARWPELDPARHVLIVYDDLDLPAGKIRLRPSGGAGGHNGIGSILERLDSKAVARLRFGVGRPDAGIPVIDWVLSAFAEDVEAEILPDSVDRAVRAIEAVVAGGITTAMGQFNSDR